MQRVQLLGPRAASAVGHVIPRASRCPRHGGSGWGRVNKAQKRHNSIMHENLRNGTYPHNIDLRGWPMLACIQLRGTSRAPPPSLPCRATPLGLPQVPTTANNADNGQRDAGTAGAAAAPSHGVGAAAGAQQCQHCRRRDVAKVDGVLRQARRDESVRPTWSSSTWSTTLFAISA